MKNKTKSASKQAKEIFDLSVKNYKKSGVALTPEELNKLVQTSVYLDQFIDGNIN